jgi:ParB family chromosome partitioning protein
MEAEILRLIVQGKMLGAIAQQLALSLSRVDTVAREHGWPDMAAVGRSLEELDEDNDASTLEPTNPDPGAQHLPDGKTLQMVPVDELHPDPDNPREKLTGIEELAESIDAQGLIQPIVARRRGGRLVVVAGHRRLAAVELLQWATVETVITKDMPSDDVLAKMLVENGQRAGLDPIEEGRALARLKATTGKSSAEVGRAVGRSLSHVEGRLRLLSLPPSVQEKVRTGQMNIGEAVERSRADSGRAQGPRSSYRFHLGDGHPLASKARARCRQMHRQTRKVGAVACGECWETVIRANERETLHNHSAQTGRCALCQTPTDDTDTSADPTGDQTR